MRNTLALFVAASLAVGGMTYAADQAAKPANSVSSKTDQTPAKAQPLQLPDGFRQKQLTSTKLIDHELAEVSQEALTKGHFSGLIGTLVDQDKTRLGQLKNPDTKTLDGLIAQIQKQWHDKYGKDFDPKMATFDTYVAIVTGEVSDPQVAVTQFPVNAQTGGPAAAEPQTAAAHQQKEDSKSFGGAVKLNKGRDVAVVRLPASHGLSPITVSMIHELPDMWRIDIPNDRTGYEVLNDLQSQLTTISKASAQWPTDVNEGYRMVTHHVLMALYGVNSPHV